MKIYLFTIPVLFLLIFAGCEKNNSGQASSHAAASREFYQLKIYSFDTDIQEEAADHYFEHAYLPALKKQGIGKTGVFRARLDEKDTLRKIYVLIPFSSMDQFASLEENLLKDETYLAAGEDFINASPENAPYKRIESVLMKAFPDMPAMDVPKLDGPRVDRVYELRSYESATEAKYRNKVDMFNAGGEIKLFDRLNFNAVFYAEVLSGAHMPNLMYMTTFNDQVTRDSLWKEFFASPEWTELKAIEKYKNNVSHADIMFMYPTEYSDY
ncbi:MAG: NIPSNAP family protein [Bacteroidia bacterium]